MKLKLDPKFLMMSAVALAVPAVADWVARKVAGRGYEAVAGEPPPRNPAVLGVGWKDAVVWTVVAGAIGGVARMASRKMLSHHGLPAER